MILTRTPFRVSFFGGGTDYPTWYMAHGGAFLSMAINKYCYISMRRLPPFFEHSHRIVYSLVENVKSIDQIKHPVVREVLKWKDETRGLEIHHDGDLPARSGLGSSSSFSVGFIKALYAFRGQLIDKKELASQAIYTERDLLQETVGIQDQIAAAFGGLNWVEIEMNGDYRVNPLILTKKIQAAFESHLLLCFTGLSRFASEVAEQKVANLINRQHELKEMQSMVVAGAELLIGGDFEGFGRLLDESWQLKRSLAHSISNDTVDDFYNIAKINGAWGGKLLGAGGGGFMLFIAPPSAQLRIKQALPEAIFVPISMDSDGSRVAMYQPDEVE